MNQNNLLILERSSSALEQGTSDKYVLEGIFGEIDKKNRNNRIYTESEYVPQIEALQQKIQSSKLLGELDHPAKFDISLKNVSHIIEELKYDAETKQVRGRIRLLDTEAGRQAKALVDAGVPLQISSRAAGAVESNGQVKIKQLFTYDLVADPGFENAELTRINESLGFDNTGDILIYDMSNQAINETELIETENNNQETIMENKARFVSVDDFNKYSAYLAEEIKALKESLAGTSTDNIEEKVNALTSYVEYVAERADRGIQYSEYVAENLDKSIQHSDHIAEKLEESILYTEHVAESASKIKEYANYLAEAMNEGSTDFENVTKYLNYLKENVESVAEYADYVAETINSNLIVEEEGEDAGVPAEELEDELDDVTPEVVDADGEEYAKAEDRAEDVADELEDEIVDGDEGAKEVEESEEGAKDLEEIEDEEVEAGDNSEEGDVDPAGEEAGEEAEDLKADMEEVNSEDDKGMTKAADKDMPSEEDAMTEEEANDGDDVVGTEAEDLDADMEEVNSEDDKGITKDADKDMPSEEDAMAEESVSPMDAYKNEISEKLSALINKATEKKTNNPHFFKFVSEATQNRFNELEESDKTKVLSSVEGRGYLTEGQIEMLMESALVEVAGQAVPYFIEVMPTEYKETYSNLSEAKKAQLEAQAKMVKLTTPYQVRNFWQTRDLRETAPVMEKVTMISESKVEAPKSTIGYSTEGMAEAFAKRFNK